METAFIEEILAHHDLWTAVHRHDDLITDYGLPDSYAAEVFSTELQQVRSLRMAPLHLTRSHWCKITLSDIDAGNWSLLHIVLEIFNPDLNKYILYFVITTIFCLNIDFTVMYHNLGHGCFISTTLYQLISLNKIKSKKYEYLNIDTAHIKTIPEKRLPLVRQAETTCSSLFIYKQQYFSNVL